MAVVRLLLERKVSIDSKDNYGWTALYMVTSDEHEAAVRLLLEHKADINAKDSLRTALHRVVSNRNEMVVRPLLEYKADVDAKDNDGQTTLHRAATWRRFVVVVRLLLEHQGGHQHEGQVSTDGIVLGGLGRWCGYFWSTRRTLTRRITMDGRRCSGRSREDTRRW
jgi:ankyrin repeat protein